MVLPLPLTPFEDYMLADDRPQWPMTFFLRLDLRGQYVPSVLEAALQAALARHPLLASLLEGDGRGGLKWIADTGIPPRASCSEAIDELDFPGGRQIDLRREIGLRLWVRTTAPDTWILWLQFHHACCDGLGAVQFVSDMLAAYRQQIAGLAPPVRPALDPSRLRGRGSFGLTTVQRLLRIPQELLGLLGAIEFFSHRPPSLTSPAAEQVLPAENVVAKNAQVAAHVPAESPAAAGFPCWIAHRFSQDETQRLRGAARTHGVTLNDLLLANLFSALDDWFAAHRTEARQQFLRVMVPMNLRSPADKQTSAANIVSLVNLDRRPARYASRRRLLKSLSLEMAIIKRCRLGITMHHLARMARRFGKFGWLVRDDRCLSTCVLSNLGEPTALAEFATGDGSSNANCLELVSVDFLPPIRPWTAAAFGVLTFRGRLTITMHFDSAMPRGSERELLDKFVRNLEAAGDDPWTIPRESTAPVEV
jgi:hypothetical protein